jgi:hypothetical protein
MRKREQREPTMIRKKGQEKRGKTSILEVGENGGFTDGAEIAVIVQPGVQTGLAVETVTTRQNLKRGAMREKEKDVRRRNKQVGKKRENQTLILVPSWKSSRQMAQASL